MAGLPPNPQQQVLQAFAFSDPGKPGILTVTVPPGAGGGTLVQVDWATGPLQFVVPDGLFNPMTFDAAMAPTQAAAPPPQAAPTPMVVAEPAPPMAVIEQPSAPTHTLPTAPAITVDMTAPLATAFEDPGNPGVIKITIPEGVVSGMKVRVDWHTGPMEYIVPKGVDFYNPTFEAVIGGPKAGPTTLEMNRDAGLDVYRMYKTMLIKETSVKQNCCCGFCTCPGQLNFKVSAGETPNKVMMGLSESTDYSFYGALCCCCHCYDCIKGPILCEPPSQGNIGAPGMMARYCCCSSRPYTYPLDVRDENHVSGANDGAKLVLYDHPCYCYPLNWCCDCHANHLKATDIASGKYLGRTKIEFYCCIPTMTVRDASDSVVYQVVKGGYCPCTDCSLCDQPFHIIQSGKQVGKMVKQDVFADMRTTTNGVYILEYPSNADSSIRAVLMGSAMMMDDNFFRYTSSSCFKQTFCCCCTS